MKQNKDQFWVKKILDTTQEMLPRPTMECPTMQIGKSFISFCWATILICKMKSSTGSEASVKKPRFPSDKPCPTARELINDYQIINPCSATSLTLRQITSSPKATKQTLRPTSPTPPNDSLSNATPYAPLPIHVYMN